MQVEASPILTTVQEENQSYHKNRTHPWKPNLKCEHWRHLHFFCLKLTAHLCTNCHVDFPLNQQTQKPKGPIYITATKHVCNELVKLNGLEFKGIISTIEIAKVKPKVTNPNKNFVSPNWFEPLRFVNNRLDLGNDIEHSEERDLPADSKRAVRHSQQNSK